MAMDPFTQQLLSYPTRNVYVEGATFPAADRFDTNSVMDDKNNSTEAPEEITSKLHPGILGFQIFDLHI